ncbi:hypothetical protein BDP81DRAFT_443411 [Colletotrichum phormii]|uniref:Uncharacterized protein n=1 Tax=Colletotrichum phormii TaxID=359342 RepID=A0AAI9ZC27_9PEZI|nr:uncharacterized protein BDP81DRAFT_443411 [Colletotrichum phormii]KAK1621532.1 hypothetical protein BDP81DRAFT_443411 [Colletotrichum phormii]
MESRTRYEYLRRDWLETVSKEVGLKALRRPCRCYYSAWAPEEQEHRLLRHLADPFLLRGTHLLSSTRPANGEGT